jgi:hypothetical protein
MLDTRKDVAGRTEKVALESTNLSRSHNRTQVRIFARAFYDSAPSWITRDIDMGA